MGAVDKLLNFMKLTEDEEYDSTTNTKEEEEEPDTERRSFFRKKDTVREESNVIEPITYTSRETKNSKTPPLRLRESGIHERSRCRSLRD